MKCYVVFCIVNRFDDKRISISHFQVWPWELSIHSDAVMGSAQPLHWLRSNLEFQSTKHVNNILHADTDTDILLPST